MTDEDVAMTDEAEAVVIHSDEPTDQPGPEDEPEEPQE